MDERQRVQYDFCRTKTRANKIQYFTKHCRMTFLLYIRYSDFQSHLDRHTTKTMRWPMRTLKTQISLGISAHFDQPSLSASRNLGPLATHWAHSKDSDQTGWMPSWSESSLDAQVILFVWSLYSFYSVLTHTRYRFFGSNDMYNFLGRSYDNEEAAAIKSKHNLFPPPDNLGKSRMQEKPSTTFLRLILYIFIFH